MIKVGSVAARKGFALLRAYAEQNLPFEPLRRLPAREYAKDKIVINYIID